MSFDEILDLTPDQLCYLSSGIVLLLLQHAGEVLITDILKFKDMYDMYVQYCSVHSHDYYLVFNS